MYFLFFLRRAQYDLVELRAITACLPERFEVDGDGRKAAWRAAFLQRVQGLVAQVNVGGGVLDTHAWPLW